MKNLIHKSLLLALCSTAIVACKPTLEIHSVGPGTADFSKYVSIGDGTPGGYADGSLNRDAQLVAFPNLLAQQFARVDGPKGFHDEFVQPLVEAGKSYGFENNKATTKLDIHYHTFCDGKKELYPEQLYSIGFLDIIGNTSFSVTTNPPYNNLGAQGAKMIYVNKTPPWKSTSATYWQKISSTHTTQGAGAATMLSDAMAQHPTFVSINVGGVDVLRFAKSGGNQDNGDDDFITPVTEYHDSLYSILNTLTAKKTNNVKGVIINVAGVNSFPYFRYIKYNGLILDDPNSPDTPTSADLNAFYGGQFTFHTGANAYVIDDATATNTCKCRQILESEYVLIEIPQDSLRCYNLGSKLPIRKRWILDYQEIGIANSTISAYNAMLKSAAEEFNFAYVDGYTGLQNMIQGIQYEGVSLTTEYVNGNQFSLDGLNIGPFGQVLTANTCLDEINKKYGSTLPALDATKFGGVVFH